MSLPPYAADLVVPIAWGLVGLLLAALVYALLRGPRGGDQTPGAATEAGTQDAAPHDTSAPDAAPHDTAAPGPLTARASTATVPSPPPSAHELAPHGSAPAPAEPVDVPSPVSAAPSSVAAAPPTAAPAPTAPVAAWDQGQPAPERPEIAEPSQPSDLSGSAVPTPDVREMRVLRRQVDVLTRTLAEWDQVRATEQPTPDTSTAAAGPAAAEPAPAPAPAATAGPVPRPSLPGAAYLDLSRRLAERGDLEGAVLAQWACDLEVLRGPLAAHEGELATAVAAVGGNDPVAVLRGCREAALALVAVAGPVRTLLAPLDHLATAQQGALVASAGFPAALVDLAPEADRPALSALVAGREGRP